MRDLSTGPVWLLIDAAGVGGIERHVSVLARALLGRGADVEIVLISDHGATPFRALLHAERLNFRVLDGSFAALVRTLRDVRPAVVHTHGYKAGVLGRIAARLCGIACASTFHAGERAPFPVSVYQRLDEALGFLSEPISVSADIAKQLPWRSTLVPNFVAARALGGGAGDPRRIVFVGRLSREKGPDLFCEVAQRCGSIAEFHVYGDGPMRAELEARHGGAVRFHGHVADVSEVWSEAGLLLIASRAEGLPMACLEAMSWGVPVAASRVGALPEVIEPGRTGWLFDVADVDAAARACEAWLALGDSERAAMRAASRVRVERTYGVDKGLAAILGVYAAALGRRPPRRAGAVREA